MEARGGPRKGSGRKPVEDKKVQIYVMVRESVIKKYGGEKEVKQKMLKSLD